LGCRAGRQLLFAADRSGNKANLGSHARRGKRGERGVAFLLRGDRRSRANSCAAAAVRFSAFHPDRTRYDASHDITIPLYAI
jgi:hypothetical protein